MKILVMGAGAVGGYLGARLFLGKNKVFLVARGKHLQAIQKDGLCVKSIYGDHRLRIPVSENPSEFGIVDLILITVKSYDTEHALSLITRNVGPHTLLLTLQNGVENEIMIAEKFEEERTLSGAAYIGARLASPGCIVHSALGKITIGIPFCDGPPVERIRDIVKRFNDSGVQTSFSRDIMKTKWTKLVWNAAFNPLSVLTDFTTHRLVESQELKDIIVLIMKEVIATAKAQGYALNENEILGKTFRLTRSVKDVKTSMLQDFERKKPLEIDALNGAVIRAARTKDVPVPINIAIMGLVKGKVRASYGIPHHFKYRRTT